MARRVYHYIPVENGDYAVDRGEKMLCGQERKWNTWHNSDPNRVTCKRCSAKLARMGLLENTHVDGDSYEEKLKRVGDLTIESGDKKHDEWLKRMGIG